MKPHNDKARDKVRALFDTAPYIFDELERLYANERNGGYGANEALMVFFDDLAECAGIDPESAEEISAELLQERNTD